jgi:hypothetical protein
MVRAARFIATDLNRLPSAKSDPLGEMVAFPLSSELVPDALEQLREGDRLPA